MHILDLLLPHTDIPLIVTAGKEEHQLEITVLTVLLTQKLILNPQHVFPIHVQVTTRSFSQMVPVDHVELGKLQIQHEEIVLLLVHTMDIIEMAIIIQTTIMITDNLNL